MSLHRITLAAITLLSISVAANAGLTYTFDTGADGFQNVAWSATGPAGWAGGAAIQPTSSAGGWTLGGGPFKEFVWATGEQTAMQGLTADSTARLAFDVIVDGTTFPAGAANWYQVNIAGNSDGAAGWTQTKVVDAWHNADDNAMYTTHVDIPFSQVGWQPGDTWFQLYLGANSDGAFPVKFYMDNLTLTTVPEPVTGLLLIGGLGMLLRGRNRKS